jgi:membrane fusion protein (multidrug efflux system)
MAELQRAHADIRAPITGRIGQSDTDIGELATAGQTRLATVSTLDPVLVEFNISEREYLAMMAGNSEARAEAARAASRPIQLLLADGSVYAHPARFTFLDRAISKATGSLALQAEVPNPEGILRPGMNTRVRITYSVAPDALLVPQRAVTEMLGKHFVLKVGAEDRIEQQAIEPGPRMGEMWVIAAGLSAGDRVVTDGIQTVKPGQQVAVRPASTAPASANIAP